MCIFIQDEIVIKIGALDDIFFEKGYYLYIGSAMGDSGSSTLINRLKRHVSPPSRKKVHWHIDYLLESEYAIIYKLWLIPSNQKLECVIAQELLTISDDHVAHFGASDCKCASHLMFFKDFNELLKK